MKVRHKAREAAFQILYRYDLDRTGGDMPFPQGSDLEMDLDRHFDHFDVPPQARDFAAKLVRGTIAQLAEMDQLIERNAIRWKVSRMPFVDRNLLRMACFELIHFGSEIPASVTIDEAVELGKRFGTAETGPFVNGILDTIASAARAPSSESGASGA